MINQYMNKNLINDLIDKLYNEESKRMFFDKINVLNYSLIFLQNSKKHSLLFKDCIIALDSLNEVFSFNKISNTTK